jgi:hypothetical protein
LFQAELRAEVFEALVPLTISTLIDAHTYVGLSAAGRVVRNYGNGQSGVNAELMM